MNLLNDMTAAAQSVRQQFGELQPELAIVLGSGLSSLVEQLQQGRCLDYAQLPGFPASSVPGHAGRLWSGLLHGRPVLLFQGRFHCYENYSAFQVSAPVRLAEQLGCQRLLLTNAAGGIAPGMVPGDFMLVADHLNLTADNPLRGLTPPPFVDLSSLYRHDFHPSLAGELRREHIGLHLGTLAWLTGPSYETPAEIRMLEMLGAAAVSMSTIPEAIMARALGLEVVALSLIANVAAGKASAPLRHDEVLAEGKQAKGSFQRLVQRLLPLWS